MHITLSCNFLLVALTGFAACTEADLTAEESYVLEARVSTLQFSKVERHDFMCSVFEWINNVTFCYKECRKINFESRLRLS